MKKIIISVFIFGIVLGALLFIQQEEVACAGGKCHFRMTCLGNASIKATVCTSDCSSSATKQKVINAFKQKMKCSSPSTPSSSNSSSGWRNCDITLN